MTGKKEAKKISDFETLKKYINLIETIKTGESTKKGVCKALRVDIENLELFIKELKKKNKKAEKELKEKAGIKDNEKLKIEKELGEIPEEDEDLISKLKFFYDRKGFFWMWNDDEFKYEIVDDVEILNKVAEISDDNIINPKSRTLILNTLKQEGRKKIPKEIPKYFVQFKGKLYNIETDEIIEASPDYFITNPLSYEIGRSDKTPTIDKLFIEWVGVENSKALYEIIAYCCVPDQFLQRIIGLCGAGSNGKGTYLNLIKNFIGEKNTASSTIKAISLRNFETSGIYKKLVCFFGEADSSDLANTNIIKSLTGEDLIRYEFKNKTPFSEHSPTTPIIATNSLPMTPDKSDGFYRRWLIIDFPNQFKIKRDLLKQIPEQEYKNLSRKIIKILKELYRKQEFTNEGDIEFRRRRYEERSNPIITFISECFDEGIGFFKLKDFSIIFNEYLKRKKLRPYTINKIGKLLREEGFEISTRKYGENNEDSAKSIIGLSLREIKSIEKNSGLSGKINHQNHQNSLLTQIPTFTLAEYENEEK